MELVGEIIGRKELLKWGHTRFLEKKALVRFGNNSRVVLNGVVEGPDGSNVLPYFIENGILHIVLVAQFRHAVEAITWEAPGGVVDSEDVKLSMARELKEETGIKINPADIKVVFKEYLLPQLVNAFGWGGVVEISKNDLSPNKIYGEPQEGEFTSLIVKPFVEIIDMRRKGDIILDFWTSRLINELARIINASALPSR